LRRDSLRLLRTRPGRLGDETRLLDDDLIARHSAPRHEDDEGDVVRMRRRHDRRDDSSLAVSKQPDTVHIHLVVFIAQLRVTKLRNSDIVVRLTDGRAVSAPLAWFPRLFAAPVEERKTLELIGDGIGLHRPTLNEDLSVGFVRGIRSRP